MKRWWGALGVVAGLAYGAPASAEPIRIVVAAGHRYGAPEERPLRYARDDAARVVDVFTAIGGVRKEAAFLADEPTVADLTRAIDKAAALAGTHKPEEVTFILYFSGHGDRASLHLGGEALPVADLSARVGRIPAALRVVVLDACRTDDTLRAKGMQEEPAFAVALPGTVTGEGSATGTVWIQASAEGDPAQESQELAGGVFTHYWLSGLRGAADADGDRRVTLGESYDYAYHQTLFKTARASGVLQRPTARLDLRAAGPIVLTTPSPLTARIVLPQVADAQFLVYEPRSRHVLAEAWSAPDRAVAIALPPGSYVVQRRAHGRGGASEVALARGEERSLSGADFHDVPLEALARKGGAVILSPNEFEAAYLPSSSPDVSIVQRGGVRYQRRFDGFALGIGVDAGGGATTNAARHVGETSVGGGVAIEWREGVGPATFRAGIGPRLEWIEQRLERNDAERATSASYSARDTKHAVGVGGAASLRVSVSPFSRGFSNGAFFTGGGTASVVAAPATTGTVARFSVTGELGAGVAF